MSSPKDAKQDPEEIEILNLDRQNQLGTDR